MGNCSFRSVAISNPKESNTIRIMTDSGDIVEFEGPKFTWKVLLNFPGYGIFPQGRISLPLQDNEELRSGQIYFLLPIGESKLVNRDEHYGPKSESDVSSLIHACENSCCDSIPIKEDCRNLNKESPCEDGAVRMSDNLIPKCKQTVLEPTRRDKDTVSEPARMSTSVEVMPPPQKGVWKVKFVINTKQLEEILSEEVNTEALIQQMRLAASSGVATPRRTKINWGQWRANWKSMRSNVSKNSDDQSKILSLKSGTVGLIETKTQTAMSQQQQI